MLKAGSFTLTLLLTLRAQADGSGSGSRRYDDVVICALRTRLAVEFGGTTMRGTYCYTRVWAREAGAGWRVAGGHVSAAASTA